VRLSIIIDGFKMEREMDQTEMILGIGDHHIVIRKAKARIDEY